MNNVLREHRGEINQFFRGLGVDVRAEVRKDIKRK